MIKKRKKQIYSNNTPYASSSAPWLITGLLCGLMIAGLIYLYKYSTFSPNPYVQALSAGDTKGVEEPEFDFYNILPEMTVPKSKPERSTTLQSLAVKPVVKQSGNKEKEPKITYLIQVASFLHLKDADEMKAELLLTGYTPVQIKQFSKDNKIWYRVLIGPYSKLSTAKTLSEKLNNNHIKNFLVTIHKDSALARG